MTPKLYRGLTTMAGPFIRPYLRHRIARGKEDPNRLRERFGMPSQPRHRGPLIWVHGASVGEAMSVLPLMTRLLEADERLHVLLTTGTVTSARLMAKRLPPRAVHQYVPLDHIDAVRRFLSHWHPDLALWMESELWPNLLFETHERQIPIVLLNGRMSERSFRRWRRLPWLIRPLLRVFDLCLAQSLPDAARLSTLGVPTVSSRGNLKTSAPPLPADEKELARMRSVLGDRPCWLAASTHPGEEEIVAEAHRRLKLRFPELVTIVLPRHPERGHEIATMLKGRGLAPRRRSAHEPMSPATDIYVADTLGETGLFYRLAGIVLIGGSLVRHGGQNPFEPAHLDCAILHGPHMFNFLDIVSELEAAGAAECVRNVDELAAAVERLLNDPERRAARAAAALRVAEAGRAVLDAVVADLAYIIPQEERKRAGA